MSHLLKHYLDFAFLCCIPTSVQQNSSPILLSLSLESWTTQWNCLYQYLLFTVRFSLLIWQSSRITPSSLKYFLLLATRTTYSPSFLITRWPYLLGDLITHLSFPCSFSGSSSFPQSWSLVLTSSLSTLTLSMFSHRFIVLNMIHMITPPKFISQTWIPVLNSRFIHPTIWYLCWMYRGISNSTCLKLNCSSSSPYQ